MDITPIKTPITSIASMRKREIIMSDYMEAFIAVLAHTKLSRAGVHYIAEAMWERRELTDKMVEYIKVNPEATESDLLKEANRIIAE